MTSGFDTTTDAFLGGRLTLKQPAAGYRAGVDPVLLASAVPAKPNQSVLELGCGTGAALFCLATRVTGLSLHGVEIQDQYADLCRENAAMNGIMATIETADLRTLPLSLRDMTFDHVIANPPYFDRSAGNPSKSADKDIAFAGETDLNDWIDTATRRLAHKGHLTLIIKAHRMMDVLHAIDDRLGSICITPISGRSGRDADRVLLQARKGGRGAFRLAAPVYLHAGTAHVKDGEDYRPEISDVLRKGTAFPFNGL